MPLFTSLDDDDSAKFRAALETMQALETAGAKLRFEILGRSKELANYTVAAEWSGEPSPLLKLEQRYADMRAAWLIQRAIVSHLTK